MESKEDIKQINNKLNLLLYNQEMNKELNDLSNLENTNFAIFISLIAIVISISIGLKFSFTELSIIPLFLFALILLTSFLIFNEIYLIYKNDVRARFNFFYTITYFIINVALFPFLIFFLYYFGELHNINKIYLLIISLISGLIFGIIISLIIARYFIVYVEVKLMEKFPILYSETFEESVVYKALQNLNQEELKKIIEYIKNKNENNNNLIKK